MLIFDKIIVYVTKSFEKVSFFNLVVINNKLWYHLNRKT